MSVIAKQNDLDRLAASLDALEFLYQPDVEDTMQPTRWIPFSRLSRDEPKRKEARVDFLDGSWVQHILGDYGYVAIFIVVMLESAGVPLPGETILVSAAAFAGNRHSLDIHYVVAAAAGGAIVGDNIGFWVGREFGTPLLSRWGYLIGLDEQKRKLGQYLFARHGGKIVFFGRFVALLRAFAALLAGANGLSPLRFFVFNAAGGIVWATLFGVGGFVLGEGIRRIAGPFGWAVLIAAIVFAFLLWRYYKKNEERFLDEAEAAEMPNNETARRG
jgi:membrane protein DedA with SNARE-associated domain